MRETPEHYNKYCVGYLPTTICGCCGMPNQIEEDPQGAEYNFCPKCKLGQYRSDLPVFSVCICESSPCHCCP